MEINDFNEIENSFNLDESDFSFDNDFDEGGFEVRKTRYIKPPKERSLTYKKLKYRKAIDLAKNLDFKSLDRIFVVVDGSFIFGDFIEAFIIENQIEVIEMTLSTLSLSQDNVDSLRNLIDGDYLKKINIIISDYFYSHEKKNLIPYLYDKLDVDDNFQLAVCRTHCKIYQFKTSGGKHIVIHGSVNLRSSDNLEQFIIEDNKDLYEFNQEYNNAILEKYKTINKSIKSRELWQVVADNMGT